jgi:hypothetical protein
MQVQTSLPRSEANPNIAQSISPPPGFHRPNQVQASLPISAANPYITQSTSPATYPPYVPVYNPLSSIFGPEGVADSRRRTEVQTALRIPLPDQTEEELEIINAPLTPMEMSEIGHPFHQQPLDVADGVAVTEEGVELHLADLITQV